MITFCGDDDGQTSPELSAMHYNLYPPDRRHLIDVVTYPGAGHLLEPPYNPLCRHCWNPFFGQDLFWGGFPKEHAAAQEDMWPRVLEFFKKHLR